MRTDFDTFAALYEQMQVSGDNRTFLNHLEENHWKTYSKKEFLQTVRYLALAFEAQGWRGKQVAIAITPSIYWVMIDYALMLSGSVSVPLFTNISTKNMRFELEDADVQTVFTQTSEQEALIKEINSTITCIDIDTTDADRPSLQTFIMIGKERDKHYPDDFDKILSKIKPDDVVTIVYTSGTSGLPKGVELSHTNLISQIQDTAIKYHFDPHTQRALSFLPLAHIFERMVMHFYLYTGISIYFADDVKNVGKLLNEVHPTVMTVVPRLLEKVYIKMHNKGMQGSWIKRLLVKLAFARAQTKDPTAQKNWLDKFYDKVVYSQLRTSMGGALEMVISGGAPLLDDLNLFFLNIGIPPYQGYGLTEASPVICANAPGENKVGTCGRRFVHTEVQIADDGELLARGPGIMIGYHDNEKGTKEAIDEQGWLHTGDLAHIDSEGYITITGRKKDLSKTSTGEYISVNFIEGMLLTSGLFDHVLIVGNNRPFVVALLVLDPDAVKEFAMLHKIDNIDDVLAHKLFRKKIKTLLEGVNKKLNHWEKIRDFYLTRETFTIENGDLTPSMKLAREQIEDRFQEEIEALYAGHDRV